MPAKHPRVNIVLEPGLYHLLSTLAHKDGISMSLEARDLIREALEIREDAYWQAVAVKREKSFSLKKSLSHKQVWK